MNENGLDAYKVQKNDIAHYRIFKLLVGHCVSAVLDNDYFVVITLNVGQGVNKHLRAY